MPDVLVRDVDAKVLERLKKRAAENGRSLQSEVRSLINSSVEDPKLTDAAVARKIRNALRSRHHTDSAELLREDRAR